MPREAVLLLEDGTLFRGSAFGAAGEAAGEVVFNTSMTGYQEILTDPSYRGQIVTMTYPLIGNYGVNPEDDESAHPWLEGFVVKEYTPVPSNWRAREPLDALLKRRRVVAVEGIDTRALTRRIRERGAMRAILSTETDNAHVLLERLKRVPPLIGRDLVSEVTCAAPYAWEDRVGEGGARHVVVYDFGVKRNILRMLAQLGCRVSVVPARTAPDAVLAMRPDGILLSNGPGDPEAVSYAIAHVKALLGVRPLFGICLGHQILSLALGGKAYKMKFGHHGGNQPVMDLGTGRVQITAQNHGFAIDFSAVSADIEVTHINLNDRTVEGMRHRTLHAASVQYHPEAAPGPHDAGFFLKEFVESLGK